MPLPSVGKCCSFYSFIKRNPLFQYDYCGEHYTMYCCERLGAPVAVKKSNDVKRKFWNFWKNEPRTGCRCKSTTKKYFENHYDNLKREVSAAIINKNAKIWKPRRQLRGFHILKAAIYRCKYRLQYRTKIIIIREQLAKIFDT